MTAFTIEEKMLYCPKCQQTYNDGSQRFCNNDGGRLLPAPNSPDSPKSSAKSGGVFTNLLGKTEPPVNNDEKLASLPRFVKSEHSSLPVYEVPVTNKFKQEVELELELELEPPIPKPINSVLPKLSAPEPQPIEPPKPAFFESPNKSETETEIFEIPKLQTFESSFETDTLEIPFEPRAKTFEIPLEIPKPPTFEIALEIPKPPTFESSAKPVSRIIDPNEIPSGTAEIGDRKTNPAGRNPLNWENPQAIIGALVKGRYSVIEQIEDDETSVSYLADDQLVPLKKVVVRVLMGEDSDDEFVKTIYSEERISLAHVDHPNIVKVIDSGELLEGKQFVVTEFIEADSVADVLKKSGQFNALRTARIIRQIAYGLSEAHQNGILHRNLKPENLLLAISEAGIEQVKLTHFGISSASIGDLHYKSPEVLEGKLATFAGDIYSLAVIAYQMLTNRLPFAGRNEKELLKAQRAGLRLHPTTLRLDLPSSIDKVLEKAMTYEPTERYPKARDFGDAFFNALTISALWEESDSHADTIEISPAKTKNEIIILPVAGSKMSDSSEQILESGGIDRENIEVETDDVMPIIGDIHITPREEKEAETAEIVEAKTSDPTWTRRSPEPPQTVGRSWLFLSVLGLAALLLGIWGIWTYFLNRPAQTTEVLNQPEAIAQTQPTIQTVTPNPPQNSVILPSDFEETPPLPRQISQPPNTVFFQNSKQEAKGDLLRNFLSFTLYYPKDWKVNEALESQKAGTRGKFMDISRNTAGGTPIEKMLISYYDSKGTFKADSKNFPKFVKETNETLKKIVPNYQMLSEGEIKINGDWKAYEIKFQGGGESATGEKLNLWGRRLFIPMARPGVRSGYEITMFATSLSTKVKSVDDVGVKGELGTILETFEPNQNF